MKVLQLLIFIFTIFAGTNEPVFASAPENLGDDNPVPAQVHPEPSLFARIYPTLTYMSSIVVASEIAHLSSSELLMVPGLAFFVSPYIIMKTVYRNRAHPSGPLTAKRRFLGITLHASATLGLTACYAALRVLAAH